MALQIGDNFSYKGRKPLDSRLIVNDIASMTGLPDGTLYDGILVYVLSEEKFYVYNSTNTADPILQKWRELKTAGISISNAKIDNIPTSATYGHLILTLDDGTNIDCGNAIGNKGDTGDGFAIAKIYKSIDEILTDPNPVNEGDMIALIETNATTGDISAKIYIRHAATTANGKDLDGYIFFCDLADATIIQGPQGPQGMQGIPGETPIIAISPIAATATTPIGQKVTFTTSMGTQNYSVYNGVDGISVISANINASNELVFTLSNGTSINVGVVKGDSANSSSSVIMLGCFNANPGLCQKDDVYYNTVDKKLHTAIAANTWDNGAIPKENILYISIDDKKIYVWTDGDMVSYGSGDIMIDPDTTNAIKENIDGLYVEDLSQKVNQINIAQKTVNEDVGYIQVGCSDHTESLVLGSVLKFPYIRDSHNGIDYDSSTGIFKLKAGKTYSLEAQITMFETYGYFYYIFKDITKNKEIGTGGKTEFNTSRSYHDDKGNIASALYTPDADTEIQLVINSTSTGSFKIQGVSYIKITEIGRNIIIDPVNYIDATQGIQDVPVGQIVEVLGHKDLQQYRQCNGDTIDIGVYPDLEQKLKEVYSVNMFGGDGVTNYMLPNIKPTVYRYISKLPEMTAPNAPTPYVVTASSEYDSRYQAYMAFNSQQGDAGYCWHTKGNEPIVWLQIDYGSPVKINAFRLRARSSYSGWANQMPTSFKLQGSNDGTTFTTIKEYSGLSWGGTNYEGEFLLDNDIEYRFYRLMDMVAQTSVAICLNKVEYLYTIRKSSYIKVKPTYFIDSINGYEERKFLMDTPVLIPCTNGMLKPGTEISLSESLDNYDYVEVHVGADYAGTPFGKHVTRIPVSEIIYSPDKTEWRDTYQEWICDQNTSFALWYGFKDAQTLYVGRMQANVNSDPSNYRGCQIIKIVGIRNRYKIEK